MKGIRICILLFSVVLSSQGLWATGIRSGQEVIIDKPVEKNLHIAAGKIRVEAPMQGDLLCAGGEIRINESVRKDIVAIGGDIHLAKAPGEDVRLVGGKIHVTDNVPGDLVVTGGEVVISEAVTIGGDLIIAGGKVEMYGVVKGDAEIAAGELVLYGVIEGGLNARGGKIEMGGQVAGPSTLSAENMQITSDARFGSDVRYWFKTGSVDFEQALSGGATAVRDEALKLQYSEWQRKSRLFQKRLTPAFMLYRLASGALLIGLLVSFFGGFFAKIAGGTQRSNLGGLMGVGTLYLVGIPFVIGIAAVTIVGIPTAFAVGSLYSATLSVAGALTAIVGAYELDKRLARNWSKGQLLLVSIGFYVALKALNAFPLAGGLAVFVLTAIAFGFIIQAIRGKIPPAEDNPAEKIVEDMV